jgi:hypothetical protein
MFLQTLASWILSEADLERLYRGNAKRIFKLGDEHNSERNLTRVHTDESEARPTGLS